MNIFYLHSDPFLAAQAQCDKHVVKMVTESAQLLCSVGHTLAAVNPPYLLTHANHPCAKWARERSGNFVWLWDHFEALSFEYSHRYHKVHLSFKKMAPWLDACGHWIADYLPMGRTDPPQVMPEQYRGDDPVAAYRDYYRNEKARFARWSVREPPEWWGEAEGRKAG